MLAPSRHERFDKQFKKLRKKYRTLEDDLSTVENYTINLLHIQKVDNNSIFLVPGLSCDELQIYKIKKIACKSLPGKGVRSGLRIIYALYPQIMKIEYLEIYYKEKSDTDMDYDFVKEYIRIRKNNKSI